MEEKDESGISEIGRKEITEEKIKSKFTTVCDIAPYSLGDDCGRFEKRAASIFMVFRLVFAWLAPPPLPRTRKAVLFSESSVIIYHKNWSPEDT
jgi:hypothetical protein